MKRIYSDADYLRIIMLGRLLFGFILFYALYKLVVNIIIPVAAAFFKVQGAMKNMTPPNQNDNTPHTNDKQESKQTVVEKGDYIDFEEVK